MRRYLVLASLCLVYVSGAYAAVAHDSALTWRTLRGERFLVHYHDGAEAHARMVMAIADRVHARLAPLLKWEPQEPTEIVLSDEIDFSNGAATAFPANRILLWLAPPDGLDSLEAHAGWLEIVLQHEYTHVLHLDKARGFPRGLRRFIGRAPSIFPAVFPNALQPLWLIEGLATYHETDRARGIGRGQSSLFDMYMRMEVAGGMKPLRQINQEVDTWPGGLVPYLYGVQFYNYVAQRYGEDKVQRWIENYSDRIVPFRILNNSQRTIGRSLDVAYEDFVREREAYYGRSLAEIRARGEHAGTQLTQAGYRATQTRALPDGRVFYVGFDGRNPAALMVLQAGASEPQALAKVQAQARLDAHPRAGILVAQPQRCRNARIAYDLYRIDATNGAMQRLTHCARYRHAVWSPDGTRIAAARYALGQHRLDLLDASGKFIETLWSAAADEVLADLDWSPDGAQLVAAVWRRERGWNLEAFDFAARRWRALTSDGAIAMQPRFTRDAKSVLFTSDHGGVYNLRRLDLASGRVTTLTNVAGGAFYPVETTPDTIYYIGYGPRGFDLFRLRPAALPTPAPAVHGPAVPATEPQAVAHRAVEEYSPWQGLRPRWWLPHVVVELDRTELGALTAGTDALNRHAYALDAAYDFSLNTAVGRVDYIYDRWWPILKLHAARDNDFTRDDDDEVLRVRRSDSYQAELVLPWLRIDSRFSLHAGAVSDAESDIRTFQGVAPRGDVHDELFGLAAIWDSTQRFPLSVSRSHGREIRLVFENSDTFDGDFSGKIYTLDWRELIGLGDEHVLGLRFVQGWGTEQPRPFELGGTEGASEAPPVLVDVTFDSPFNVREYALRGYADGLVALRGRRMQLATVEWRFPIRRVERGVMTPPLALHQLAGSVFVDSGGVWNSGNSPDERRTGAGLELQVDTSILYALRARVRLGYAHGFDDIGRDQMYLRIGASF